MIPSDLIERARAVRIEDEIERRGIKLVGRVDRCGPCPLCGGKDCFQHQYQKTSFPLPRLRRTRQRHRSRPFSPCDVRCCGLLEGPSSI